jgi:hypothetical protein
MINEERFLKLWNSIIEDSSGASEHADQSPLSISNGVSKSLRDFLMDNSGDDGIIAAVYGMAD